MELSDSTEAIQCQKCGSLLDFPQSFFIASVSVCFPGANVAKQPELESCKDDIIQKVGM